jgi:hypothetical protein
MPESKPYHFYIWTHRYLDESDQIVTRTCFGITGNLDNRQQGYEGHVGHPVRFLHVWQGPERLIRELESRLKSDFHDHLFVGHRNYRYEWLLESVDTDTVVRWIEWEVENTFHGICKTQRI